MKFNLKDLNPGAKFYFDDKNHKAGSITLRALNMAALDDIRAKTVSKQVEYDDEGQRHETVKTDEVLAAQLTYDYVILAWDGVEDEAGTPIPCTVENKATLMRESLVFSRHVNRMLKKLERDMKARVEAERKN